jgi:hypothetical protein
MPRLLCYALLTLCFIGSISLLRINAQPAYSGFVAHEWGTFTSVAGADGQGVEWRPLTGSTDLPSFVEHFRNVGFKLGLRGTVRMETPVLYFYSPRAETVSVNVRFAQGVITEWYPRASRVEPTAALYDASLYQPYVDGSIAWDAVTLAPSQTADLPNDQRENHYYAARQTTSTPLRVKTPAGDQYEKFLFYRGVSAFSVPISAKLEAENKLRVQNRSGLPVKKPVSASTACCRIEPPSIRPTSTPPSIPSRATSKESSSPRASIKMKRKPWSKPGAIPGSRKAPASCTSSLPNS